VKLHHIAGTAGHIDHGKSLLIKALTGIDTDRLKEEKERGITIELGFAYLDLPGGSLLGIVDVPGHERFVRHMVAGAAGLDLIIMVIAADEGIMPQTREHLDICRMLGIEKGLVVLTKKDLADPEWLALVTEEVRDFTRGTFLEGSPVIPVSGLTGEGLPELLSTLDMTVREIEPRTPWGVFRMPVDRVFTMKGFGTVLTGTTLSGSTRVGEVLQIYPGELAAKVRGLQVHNQVREEVEAGYRTAINLQGVDRDEVKRGDTIAPPGQLSPSYIMDVRLHLLPSAAKPLASRTRIRFHMGTSEVLGRVHLLEADELEPGRSGLAQMRLEKPAVALARDRFVVRSYSPSTTIGGGVIIDPTAAKYRRRNQKVIAKLESLERGSPEEALLAALLHNGFKGGSISSLAVALNMEEEQTAECLGDLESAGKVHRSGTGVKDRVIHDQILAGLRENIHGILESFHRQNPLKAGLPREELKSRLPREVDPKVLALILAQMEEQGTLTLDAKLARLSGYVAKLDDKQLEQKKEIEASLKKTGLAAPSPSEMARNLKMDPVLLRGLVQMMVEEGLLVKVHEHIFVHRDHLESLIGKLEEHFMNQPDLTVGHFKELTGLTRKHSIPYLEYFDRHGITLRVGDKRVARRND
jgi:selenocysteine-specific elongation factor